MQASALGTLITFVLVIASSLNVNAQDQIIKYRKSDYPDANFMKTEQRYSHGHCRIHLIQVKNTSHTTYSPFICRVWVEIERDNRIIHEIYLSDIDPIGAQFGLFIPQQPPNAAFFAIVKLGDYDGTLYLVDKEGNFTEYWGGEYFVTADEKYLLSEHHSDLWGVEVIDLANGMSLFRSEESDSRPSQWYYNKSGKDMVYYYVNEDISDSIYVCDIMAKKITAKALDPQYVSASHKIEHDFTLPEDNDCECVEYSKPDKHFNVLKCDIRLTELGRRANFQFNIRYHVTCNDIGEIQIKRLFPQGYYEGLIDLNSLETCMRSWGYSHNKEYWVSFCVGTNEESSVTIAEKDGKRYKIKLW